ncbi:MAG: hypothetical protein J6R47_02035 [Acholeplasmatales bacterium]|nr:hypothetical protein [Acholeplasmatales bacterium]
MFLDVKPYLAIGVIVVLLGLYILLYLMNKKTPVPKGCEAIKISDENCSTCGNLDCSFKKIDVEKINEEIKKEKEQEL